jgi:hypothetical protein
MRIILDREDVLKACMALASDMCTETGRGCAMMVEDENGLTGEVVVTWEKHQPPSAEATPCHTA